MTPAVCTIFLFHSGVHCCRALADTSLQGQHHPSPERGTVWEFLSYVRSPPWGSWLCYPETHTGDPFFHTGSSRESPRSRGKEAASSPWTHRQRLGLTCSTLSAHLVHRQASSLTPGCIFVWIQFSGQSSVLNPSQKVRGPDVTPQPPPTVFVFGKEHSQSQGRIQSSPTCAGCRAGRRGSCCLWPAGKQKREHQEAQPGSVSEGSQPHAAPRSPTQPHTAQRSPTQPSAAPRSSTGETGLSASFLSQTLILPCWEARVER